MNGKRAACQLVESEDSQGQILGRAFGEHMACPYLDSCSSAPQFWSFLTQLQKIFTLCEVVSPDPSTSLFDTGTRLCDCGSMSFVLIKTKQAELCTGSPLLHNSECHGYPLAPSVIVLQGQGR